MSAQLSYWLFFFLVKLHKAYLHDVNFFMFMLLNKTNLNFKNFVLGFENVHRLSQNHYLVWDIKAYVGREILAFSMHM